MGNEYGLGETSGTTAEGEESDTGLGRASYAGERDAKTTCVEATTDIDEGLSGGHVSEFAILDCFARQQDNSVPLQSNQASGLKGDFSCGGGSDDA